MTWLTIQLRKHYTYQDSKSIWAPLYLTTWPKSSKTKKWHWTVRGFRWFWNECIPTMSYTLTFLVWCSVSPPLARYLCPQIWFLDAWDCVSLLFFLSFPCSMEPSTYCNIVFRLYLLHFSSMLFSDLLGRIHPTWKRQICGHSFVTWAFFIL